MSKKLIKEHFNKNKERKKGFFHASEVGSIIQGYLLPCDFYKPRPIKGVSQHYILHGEAYEKQYKELLKDMDYKHEPRYEVKFDDIIITVKPDFEFADKVIETKAPSTPKTTEKLLDTYQYQLELEHRATNKPVVLCVIETPFRPTYIPFVPSDERFNKIKEALKSFNGFI